jgi:hypothetical protein
MLGFCISCVQRSNKYSGVVPGVQPMSSHLVMLANSRFVSVLLHDSNGAIVSSHMQPVIESRSLPRTVTMCTGSFYLRSLTFMLKLPLKVKAVPSWGRRTDTRLCFSQNFCNEDLTGTESRLWNSPQAMATESKPRYRDSLGPPCARTPGGPKG